MFNVLFKANTCAKRVRAFAKEDSKYSERSRKLILNSFFLLFCMSPALVLADECNVSSTSVVFSPSELSKDTVAQRDVAMRVECSDQQLTWGLKTTPTPFYLGDDKEASYAVFYQKNQAIVDDESAVQGSGSQDVVMRLFVGRVKDKSVAVMGPGFFEPLKTASAFAFAIPVILTYGLKAQVNQTTVSVSGQVPTTCSFGTISRVVFDQVRIGMIPRQNVTIPLSCDSEKVAIKLSSSPTVLAGLPEHVAAIYENTNSLSFLGANGKEVELTTAEAKSWFYQTVEVRIGTGSLATGVTGAINKLGTFSGSIPITVSW